MRLPIAIATTLVASALAAAPADATVSHGEWKLALIGGDCILGHIRKDDTGVILELTPAGRLTVTGSSPDWDIGQGEAVDVTFNFVGGGKWWYRGATGSLGKSGGGFGFVWDTANRAGFLRAMQGASAFDLVVGGRSAGRFPLAGSSSGVSALQRCAGVTILRSAMEIDVKQRERMAKMDDWIGADSRSWMMNRYDRGSVSSAEIVDTDVEKGTVTVRAHYTFNGGQRGWVDAVHSARGVCLRFWDNQYSCKPVG